MKWNKKEISTQAVKQLAERFELDTLTASVLLRRGITDPGELLFVLENDLVYLHNPFLFSAMEDAVDRILQASEEGEEVFVFGDRDSDGVLATVLMVETLEGLNLHPTWQVPETDDSYGLSIDAVEKAVAQGVTLIITVDCGISCFDSIALARAAGIDVIVVDHHRPREGGELPDATVILDPKIQDCGYPFRDLSGCAVAYKLANALDWGQTDLYKREVVLLNAAPVNDAIAINAVKLVNLVETARISETVIPGMLSLDTSRLARFLKDSIIMVWDGDAHKSLLAKAFGKGVEVQCVDLEPEIGAVFPSVRGKSLARLQSQSRLSRYSSANGLASASELDVLVRIFTSYSIKRANIYADDGRLQLAAISTVTDIMPLCNENRILVRQGMSAVNAKARKGVRELLARIPSRSENYNASDISWRIGPVINSAGRLGSAGSAVRLLLEEDPQKREEAVSEILGFNSSRKLLALNSWEPVLEAAFKSRDKFEGKLAVVVDQGLHRGIIGILAQRIVGALKVPAIVITQARESMLVGSIRATRGFPASDFLRANAQYFSDYGGHESAAGFSMNETHLEAFFESVREFMAAVELHEEEAGEIDAELPHTHLKPDLLDLSDRLSPFGAGFPELVFLAKNVPVLEAQIVGKTAQSHLKFSLDFGDTRWTALYWNGVEAIPEKFSIDNKTRGATRLDIVFKLSRNYFNGMSTPQLEIIDAWTARQA